MPIDVLCPGCGKTLRLGDEHAGKTGKCPACQTHFPIPTPNQPSSQPPIIQPEFEQLVSQLQPPGNNTGTYPLERKALFAESASGESKPVVTESSARANANPYAAPYTTTPFQPTNNGSDPSATAATVLGVISILCATVGFCCCFISLLSYPLSIIGLVLAYQAPPQLRQMPLILNVIGLILPTISGIVGALLIGIRHG